MDIHFCFLCSRLREDEDDNNNEGKSFEKKLEDYKEGEKIFCFVKTVSSIVYKDPPPRCPPPPPVLSNLQHSCYVCRFVTMIYGWWYQHLLMAE